MTTYFHTVSRSSQVLRSSMNWPVTFSRPKLLLSAATTDAMRLMITILKTAVSLILCPEKEEATRVTATIVSVLNATPATKCLIALTSGPRTQTFQFVLTVVVPSHMTAMTIMRGGATMVMPSEAIATGVLVTAEAAADPFRLIVVMII